MATESIAAPPPPHEAAEAISGPHVDAAQAAAEIPIQADEIPIEDDAQPDHYWDGGHIPVFRPTWEEFRDFQRYMRRVDAHGARAGIGMCEYLICGNANIVDLYAHTDRFL